MMVMDNMQENENDICSAKSIQRNGTFNLQLCNYAWFDFAKILKTKALLSCK